MSDCIAPTVHDNANRTTTPHVAVAPRAKQALPMTPIDTPAADDKRPSVSAPAGRLLAAKSERIRLPNTSPNFRARALS
jgi:hypothetical protein